ncbi:uncharacterized protein MONOS_14241 [Monocercomonoides exilis]|uniref:uncharacterized protein n=1 Tax=Monocercomonoides exilis TaxID=2049356 RepID=UPI003559A5E8|nr:hypothetical protein MONOS_14241 [Monocercomonoides exilis]|eukprot:MONOS_14241.1-p1 / transcript=MONOS_14241.1 / gene=MONOS_14241 / organism=Monocercomonoides_exilis_PA203 / gene_product=unspecified product / transcript_product=unspecified product / location=Mono_scaffold00961:15718-16149(-) / protein_length=144 / sequence_SO=supercontig / SO=protein_coding / is_pseudo=false
MGDGEGGRDWGVGIMEEIVCGGEEGEGEDGRLVGDEGEVCEGEGGMGREEEGAVVVVAVGEGRWVDGASGGADGGSRVVLGSEEWTATERDEVEMGHAQEGVDDKKTCFHIREINAYWIFNFHASTFSYRLLIAYNWKEFVTF